MSEKIIHETIGLLQELVQTPSFSKEEGKTADILWHWMTQRGMNPNRAKHNVWAQNQFFDPKKPTILLNSHHDTVKPNGNYTLDPFEPRIADGRIWGLGSNDAGGCLVSLLQVFAYYWKQPNLKYNLIFAATAEEEISGKNGISFLLPLLPLLDFAIVGEPTEMHMAIAEKGLLVIDAFAPGIPGHAAHDNTQNAIYTALEDIHWIRNYEFPKTSPTLGQVKAQTTQIDAGEQHNMVPGSCHFVIDVRITDAYDLREVFDILDQNTQSRLLARSFRLNSSSIGIDHPFVQAGVQMGRATYGSPTLSDQALLNCPSVKIGPGKSERSHRADEFIEISEIEAGITIYQAILNQIL